MGPVFTFVVIDVEGHAQPLTIRGSQISSVRPIGPNDDADPRSRAVVCTVDGKVLHAECEAEHLARQFWGARIQVL